MVNRDGCDEASATPPALLDSVLVVGSCFHFVDSGVGMGVEYCVGCLKGTVAPLSDPAGAPSTPAAAVALLGDARVCSGGQVGHELWKLTWRGHQTGGLRSPQQGRSVLEAGCRDTQAPAVAQAHSTAAAAGMQEF